MNTGALSPHEWGEETAPADPTLTPDQSFCLLDLSACFSAAIEAGALIPEKGMLHFKICPRHNAPILTQKNLCLFCTNEN